MKLTPELIIALWGAFIATSLALKDIIKSIRDRPRINVRATTVTSPTSLRDDAHGVIIRVQHGDDVITEEANIQMTIENAGARPAQITSVYVEGERFFSYVNPESLPAFVESQASLTLVIQPEWFAPWSPEDEYDASKGRKELPVLSAGVCDGLGKKYPLLATELAHIVDKCRELPLRRHLYENKETGKLVSAFTVTDEAHLVKK